MYIELVLDNVEIIHAIQKSDIQEIIGHLRKKKKPGMSFLLIGCTI